MMLRAESKPWLIFGCGGGGCGGGGCGGEDNKEGGRERDGGEGERAYWQLGTLVAAAVEEM